MSLEQQIALVRHVGPGEGSRVWTFLGDRYTVKASAAETGGRLGLMEAIVAPESGPPLHIHENEHEVFYLLDGQLEMEANDTVFVADAGSFIFVPREVPHRFKNISNTPTRLLFLFFPGGFEQFFLDIGNPVIEGQEKPSAVQYEPDVMRVAPNTGCAPCDVLLAGLARGAGSRCGTAPKT